MRKLATIILVILLVSTSLCLSDDKTDEEKSVDLQISYEIENETQTSYIHINLEGDENSYYVEILHEGESVNSEEISAAAMEPGYENITLNLAGPWGSRPDPGEYRVLVYLEDEDEKLIEKDFRLELLEVNILDHTLSFEYDSFANQTYLSDVYLNVTATEGLPIKTGDLQVKISNKSQNFTMITPNYIRPSETLSIHERNPFTSSALTIENGTYNYQINLFSGDDRTEKDILATTSGTVEVGETD